MSTVNWQQGKKGFQSKLSQEQQLELVEVWVQNNWATRPAKMWLKEAYGIELKQNTFWYYKKRLREAWERADSSLDSPADWEDFVMLTTNGVPAESRRAVHQAWMGIENDYRRLGLVAIKPTYRRLHWWSYVIEYHGDIIEDSADRQYIAEEYTLRHMAADLFGLPMETDDLNQWLYYQPWKGGDKEVAYLQAIDTGLVPPIMKSLNSSQLGHSSTEQTEYAMRTLSFELVMQYAPKPYLLPSQLGWEKLMQAVTKSLESSAGEEEEANSQ